MSKQIKIQRRKPKRSFSISYDKLHHSSFISPQKLKQQDLNNVMLEIRKNFEVKSNRKHYQQRRKNFLKIQSPQETEIKNPKLEDFTRKISYDEYQKPKTPQKIKQKNKDKPKLSNILDPKHKRSSLSLKTSNRINQQSINELSQQQIESELSKILDEQKIDPKKRDKINEMSLEKKWKMIQLYKDESKDEDNEDYDDYDSANYYTDHGFSTLSLNQKTQTNYLLSPRYQTRTIFSRFPNQINPNDRTMSSFGDNLSQNRFNSPNYFLSGNGNENENENQFLQTDVEIYSRKQNPFDSPILSEKSEISSDKVMIWMRMNQKMESFFSQETLKDIKTLIGIKGIALLFSVLSTLPRSPFIIQESSNDEIEDTEKDLKIYHHSVLKTLINLTKNSIFFSELASQSDPALLTLNIENIIIPIIIPILLFDILVSYYNDDDPPQLQITELSDTFDLKLILFLLKNKEIPEDTLLNSIVLFGQIINCIQTHPQIPKVDHSLIEDFHEYFLSLNEEIKNDLEDYDFNFSLFEKSYQNSIIEEPKKINNETNQEIQNQNTPIHDKPPTNLIWIKLPHGIYESFELKEDLIVQDIIISCAEKYQGKPNEYGIFASFEDGEWPRSQINQNQNQNQNQNENQIQIQNQNQNQNQNELDFSVEDKQENYLDFDGDFISQNSLISNYKNKKLQILKKPPNEIDVILPPNPKDLTPRWRTIPTDALISTVLKHLCAELNVPKEEYGLLLKLPRDNSHFLESTVTSGVESSVEAHQVSFVPTNDNFHFGKLYPTKNSENAFGIWVIPGNNRKLSAYISRNFTSGYMFIKFQQRPATINLIYPRYDEVTNKKISDEEVEIIIDFTVNVKVFIYEFSRIYQLKKGLNYVLYHVIYQESDLEIDLNQKENINEKKHKDAQITDLIKLDEDLAFSFQGIKKGSVLKIIPTVEVHFDKGNQAQDESELEINENDKIENIQSNINENTNENTNLENQTQDQNTQQTNIEKPNEIRRHSRRESSKDNKDMQNILDPVFRQENIDKVSDTMDLWEEIAYGISNIVWENNDNVAENALLYERIRGASLNKSIEILTSQEGYSLAFIDLFLELLPNITDEVLFMQKILVRFNVPAHHPFTKTEIDLEQRKTIQTTVVDLIFRILEFNPQHLPQEIKSMIKNFAQNSLVIHSDPQIKKKGEEIIDMLSDKKQIRRRSVWMTFESIQKELKAMRGELTEPQQNNPQNKDITTKKDDNENKPKETPTQIKTPKPNIEPELEIYIDTDTETQGCCAPKKSKKAKENNKNGAENGGKTRVTFNPNYIIPSPKMPKSKDLQNLDIFQISDIELARQICLTTHDLFQRIHTKELLNNSWTKRNKREISPNVMNMISRFNDLADWVSVQILKETSQKMRVKKIIRLVSITESLYQMNNFNDVMAFVSGMQNSAVDRLEETWKAVPKKVVEQFKILDDLTNAINGYKKLREAFANANLPAIPYLGVYLTDLTNIEELPSRIENNLINWAKRRRIFNVIKKIKEFQGIRYKFVKVDIIQNFLVRDPIPTEDEMWELSFKILPI